MKLTVFAATGRVGRHILEQALAAGHDVTAVVRDPGRLPATPARVVAADLAERPARAPHLAGGRGALHAAGPGVARDDPPGGRDRGLNLVRS